MRKSCIAISLIALGALFADASATTSEAQGPRSRAVVNYCPPMPRVTRSSSRTKVTRASTVTTTTTRSMPR